MGRNWDENSTNVRISHEREPSLFWSLLSDWTVGEITPVFAEAEPCPACGEGAVSRGGRCEQCALEYELFHRDVRENALSSVSRS